MASSGDEVSEHLTVEDVLFLHSLVVESDEATEPGVADEGAISYVVSFVKEGHFGIRPESIHEKAYHLLRLLVANHPFVDGNKRTALLSTVAFYALNGDEFEYDRDVKRLLKALATDESAVDPDETVARLASQVTPLEQSNVAASESMLGVLRRQFREQSYKRDEDGTID